ncbi:DUF3800 domain-containing protein [Salisediminibacterium beveridgei]|uniref:DUF3800 domain-containing protein n=1 Tax=Salisediminibacterium beveridgei TaxID=632773 RepID=A0A1D7QT84_9BACI|nr:DUF3800 domain-containing protein [Salisediminibacterium beveridgei]AOM82210.1 hypothetical protein BBEV_0839 [Salisediminibacterium beveridgei]
MKKNEDEKAISKNDKIKDFSLKEQNDNKETEKKQKQKRKKEALWRSVQLGEEKNLTMKVANILNRYPETRNSDVALQVKFWEVYEGVDAKKVGLDDLFKLERLTSITRSRAKIQNEYGLFLADEKIRKGRRTLEEKQKEIQIIDQPSLDSISIYSDESGKKGPYVIVGGIWYLDSKRMARLERNIIEWEQEKKNEGLKLPKEFHFQDLNNNGEKHLTLYKDFFNHVFRNSEMISLKAIAVNKEKLDRINISELLLKMQYQLIRMGIDHELNKARLRLPRSLNITKDEEGDSSFTLEELKQKLRDQFKIYYEDQVRIKEFVSMPSHQFRSLQISDLFVASINRDLNHDSQEKNNKDKLSEYVLDGLDLQYLKYDVTLIDEDESLKTLSDQSVVFVFD